MWIFLFFFIRLAMWVLGCSYLLLHFMACLKLNFSLFGFWFLWTSRMWRGKMKKKTISWKKCAFMACLMNFGLFGFCKLAEYDEVRWRRKLCHWKNVTCNRFISWFVWFLWTTWKKYIELEQTQQIKQDQRIYAIILTTNLNREDESIKKIIERYLREKKYLK